MQNPPPQKRWRMYCAFQAIPIISLRYLDLRNSATTARQDATDSQ